jgi:transcriptional regulator with XRE-family HTH domain
MQTMDWSQSETARQLFISAPYVNQICNGKAEPSSALVQLFKLTVAAYDPKAARLEQREEDVIPYKANESTPAWSREVIKVLSELEDGDRKKILEAIKLVASVGKKGAKQKTRL